MKMCLSKNTLLSLSQNKKKQVYICMKKKTVCKDDDSDILFSLPNYHDKCGLRRHHSSKRGRAVLFTLLKYDIVSL